MYVAQNVFVASLVTYRSALRYFSLPSAHYSPSIFGIFCFQNYSEISKKKKFACKMHLINLL